MGISLDTLVRKIVTLGTAGIIALSPSNSSADNSAPPLPPLLTLPRRVPVANLQIIPSKNSTIKNPTLLGAIDFNNDSNDFSFDITWPELSIEPYLLIKSPILPELIRKDVPIIGFGNVEVLNQGNAFAYDTPEKERKYIFLIRNVQTNNVSALDINTNPPSVEYVYPGSFTPKTEPVFLLTPNTRLTIQNAPILYIDSYPQPSLPSDPINHQYHVNVLANLKHTNKKTLDDMVKGLIAEGKPIDAIRKEIQIYFDNEKSILKMKTPSLFDDPYEYSVYAWAVTAAFISIDQHYPKIPELGLPDITSAGKKSAPPLSVPPAALSPASQILPEDPAADCWTAAYTKENFLQTAGRYSPFTPLFYPNPTSDCFIEKGTTWQAATAYIIDGGYKGALLFGLGYLTYSLLTGADPITLQETTTLRDKQGPQ